MVFHCDQRMLSMDVFHSLHFIKFDDKLFSLIVYQPHLLKIDSVYCFLGIAMLMQSCLLRYMNQLRGSSCKNSLCSIDRYLLMKLSGLTKDYKSNFLFKVMTHKKEGF